MLDAINSLWASSGIIQLDDISNTYLFPRDIAIGLGRTCRFSGHTKKFYSVAEHSLKCVELAHGDGLPPRFLLDLLLHDAHEAYITDLPSPLVKRFPENWLSLQHHFQDKIDQQFGVKENFRSDRVKKYDRLALEWEWENKVVRWTGLAMPPDSGASLWEEKFVELCKATGTFAILNAGLTI
jgi:hypothetical protein